MRGYRHRKFSLNFFADAAQSAETAEIKALCGNCLFVCAYKSTLGTVFKAHAFIAKMAKNYALKSRVR